jgi:hypothetical protein
MLWSESAFGGEAAMRISLSTHKRRADQHPENETDVGRRDLACDDHDARRPFMPADPFDVAADSREMAIASLRAEAAFITGPLCRPLQPRNR